VWVSGLLSALDEVAAAEFDELSAVGVLDVVTELVMARNRLDAQLSRAVRAADRRQAYRADGAVSMPAWLRGHCRLAAAEAAQLVTSAARLEQLPATAAAFESGVISAAHARVITAAVTPERIEKAAAVGVDVAVTDETLAAAGCALDPGGTARAARRWVAGVDPDGALRDAYGVTERRALTMAVTFGGAVAVRGTLDPVGGETVRTALAALMSGDLQPGETRTHAERQADALVELARRALNGGELPDLGAERPHVRVAIDLAALCAERGAAGVAGGELAWAGPITPETARRICCDASVTRMITGPDGLPLDVGRAQRTASTAIRKAVIARDSHCVFAGCDRLPEWCDVHHQVHWAHGGPTSCENGALLCQAHHTAVHEGGFTVSRDPGTAHWRTHRPDGTEIDQPP
jgi:hypothetical protein